jgi:hypothetical protein
MDMGSAVVRQSLICSRCTDISFYCYSLSRRGYILSRGTENVFSTIAIGDLGSTQCEVSYLLLCCFKFQQGIHFCFLIVGRLQSLVR